MANVQRRNPGRLLPADPQTRAIAQDLYDLVAKLPIISPHGHVPVELLHRNEPFPNPADLLITADHYLTRLLHAGGVDMAQLGAGTSRHSNPDFDPRQAWQLCADNWHLFAGTATGYWVGEVLSEVFNYPHELGPGTAQESWDHLNAQLSTEQFRPRALFEQFNIAVLATTDDPLADLTYHRDLQAAGLQVTPTFRPDRFLDATGPNFAANAVELVTATGQPTTFSGFLSALETLRDRFRQSGAFSADHGVRTAQTLNLSAATASSLFEKALARSATAAEQEALSAHLLWQMARMSVEDGLVMTIHPGVFRNHSSDILAGFGPDTGHDIPMRTDYVSALRPLLESFGLNRDLRVVLFTVDETSFSREIAPLAGFYPAVYIGAPWWFLDAPDAISRFRGAVTETAGFYRGSGFIDDTRAYLSIPARHDTSRRVDAGYLAQLVVSGRLTVPQAEQIAVDLVTTIPKNAFKLDGK